MKLGNVQAAGSGDKPEDPSDSVYGPDQLQLGYPQLYNITIWEDSISKFANFLGSYSGASETMPKNVTSNLAIVDACINEGACNAVTQHNKQTYALSAKAIEPSKLHNVFKYGRVPILTAYLSWLAPQYFSAQVKPTVATITWMFSGQPELFGSASETGCLYSRKAMNDFYDHFIEGVKSACNTQGFEDCSTDALNFGIWNFSNLLQTNNCGVKTSPTKVGQQ